MRRLPRMGDDGLSLIELVIAIVILTFGVITAMTVLVHAQSSTEFTSAKAMATNGAQEHLEFIFATAPTSVRNFNDSWFEIGIPPNTLRGPGPAGEACYITVSDTQPRVVTVTVTWLGQGTRPGGQLTITALRSEAARLEY